MSNQPNPALAESIAASREALADHETIRHHPSSQAISESAAILLGICRCHLPAVLAAAWEATKGVAE